MLESLCHSAKKKLEGSPDKVTLILRSILTSLGQIRYRPTDLLDRIAEKLIENESQIQNKDLLAFLVATATLNYAPKNSDKLYSVKFFILSYQFISEQGGWTAFWSERTKDNEKMMLKVDYQIHFKIPKLVEIRGGITHDRVT